MFNEKKLEEIKEAEKKWAKEKVQKAISRFPERKEKFATGSNLEVDRLYTPEDVEELDYKEKLGFPGEYPFTRGVQPTMYRGRLWTMRQYAGFATAEESNKRYKYLLDQGQTGLSVAFDLPTQIGYDSDHGLSEGEVGKVGVAIDSLKDMEILFNGIPLDKVSTSMTINAPASVLLAMYIAVAEKQGVSKDKLRGTIQNDILKEYIARGTYIFPPEPSMRLITNIFEYCSKEVPKWNTISISGYHIREAGSTAAQEVAFTLADGIAYVDAAINAGLDVDDFAPRLSFFFNAHNDLLFKFVCPKMKWTKCDDGKYRRRHFCDNPCTSSPCGRMIYVYPEKDLRAYPGTLRDTEEWDKVYKIRSVVEQSINHFKESFCIAGRKTQNEKTIHADLLLAGITQLITVVLADKIHKHEYIRSLKPLIA
ncbi:methylmalonyl-CoA mutase family protein [Schnuerera ultunensis]|uniref:Methylmalonyl-CoA mutase alpha/beta chain catalytic domain-containing protein n=2 Tax=Schnuerera ultunensis TaxID=45497 RepID=A0A1M4PT80_9FIRM|nr:methylmalonyl-CoA mutase family protein [Schnuerera ultunensis]SHD78687.1 protein of unknown function [[Clostridium] ultunense Esp]